MFREVNTLYVAVALAIVAVVGFAMASTMTVNDEVRTAELYCEMTQEGYWPRAVAKEFCPEVQQ